MVTIKHVAKEAGVSIATVSHVINNTRYVSDELSKKVHLAMEKLGYHPDGIARSLRKKRTYTVGMIIPDSSNPFFAEVALGFEMRSFDLSYNVIFCNTNGDVQKESTYLDLLLKKRVDGIVFVSSGININSVKFIKSQKIPIIVVDREIKRLKVDSVLVDNLSGGYQATKHLLNLGHKRIACISGPSLITPSSERIEGYKKALMEASLEIDKKLILMGDFQFEGGYKSAKKLLRMKKIPTAIFACNDLMAIGAICAIKEAGMRVPQDISVVGFDDIALASFYSPKLTTVIQPKYKMGKLAASMLIERIKNKEMAPRRKLLKTELIIRESTSRKV
jgi:LacI family transcriptional regulator